MINILKHFINVLYQAYESNQEQVFTIVHYIGSTLTMLILYSIDIDKVPIIADSLKGVLREVSVILLTVLAIYKIINAKDKNDNSDDEKK